MSVQYPGRKVGSCPDFHPEDRLAQCGNQHIIRPGSGLAIRFSPRDQGGNRSTPGRFSGDSQAQTRPVHVTSWKSHDPLGKNWFPGSILAVNRPRLPDSLVTCLETTQPGFQELPWPGNLVLRRSVRRATVHDDEAAWPNRADLSSCCHCRAAQCSPATTIMQCGHSCTMMACHNTRAGGCPILGSHTGVTRS